jgi:hypothetical protein
MQALPPESKAAFRGLSYLRQAQVPGGGFPLGGNGAPNAQSTAWAIQGILAVGADPDFFRRGGVSAPGYLAARQAADGHYRYSKSSDQTPLWVTGEVLVAAANKYFPVPPPPREPRPAQDKPESGGLAPGETPPSTAATPPASLRNRLKEFSSPPSGSAKGGRGPLPNVLRPPGQQPPEASAATLPPAGREREGSATPLTDPFASEESAADDSSSPAGAIVLGLLAGTLLFAAALAARRLWMRQRYGL